jgi:NAD(P)-dependent dehydrogenase (short-subunit alcohol dehydrogenase family)
MPVALVTGASRGVGRGVATSLATAGFTVFATGRTIAAASLPDSIVRITCDHYDDRQTAAAVARAIDVSGTIDVLVNAAWGGYERMVEDGQFTWMKPFWQQPLHRWTSMMDGGVRAAYVAAAYVAPAMISAGRGLIVNISFWPAQKYIGNTLYGVAKAATDKLTHDAASELRPHGVSVVSLYPGLVRTEAVLAAASGGWIDLSNSESPEFIGRVVAALAADPDLPSQTGRVIVAAAYAQQHNVADVDGKQPRPLTLESV